MSEQAIGRIKFCDGSLGEAELSSGVRNGDLLYFISDKENKIICRIISVKTSPLQGVTGSFRIIDRNEFVPAAYTHLFRYTRSSMKGSFITLGNDGHDDSIKFRINSLFGNVLIAGKTRTGKTKATLLISEQLIKLRVPHLIIDTQGEHTGLTRYKNVVSTTNPEEAIEGLRRRQTVIVNMLGHDVGNKNKILYDILFYLRQIKEQDYSDAKKIFMNLKYPPILITIDEAEVFCSVQTRDLLVEYAKRMCKFGVGTIYIVQRIPRFEPDIRSQCNSALLFHNDDSTGLSMISKMPYVDSYVIKLVQQLTYDECVATGNLVEMPMLIHLNKLLTRRTKPIDFEELLGLDKETVKAEERHELEESLDESDVNILCADCGSSTKRNVADHDSIHLHNHFVCHECEAEYCSIYKKWLEKPIGSITQTEVVSV